MDVLRFSSNTVNSRKSLGGAPLEGEEGVFSPTNRTLHAFFDEITKTETINKTADYRCLYLRNETTKGTDLINPSFAITKDATTAVIEIGLLDNKQVEAEAIADETTAPNGVVFFKPTVGEYINLIKGADKKLAQGEYVAFWIKRTPKNFGSATTIVADFDFEYKVES